MLLLSEETKGLSAWVTKKGADTSDMKTSEQILERVRQCMKRALELDEEEVRDIVRNSTAADLEKWDSLSHLRLIMELEESFGIAFDDEQVGQLASVQRIMEVVGNNGR